MKRWLPHPLLSGLLLLVWLLLAQSVAPGNLLLGALLGLGLGKWFARLQPPPVRVRHCGRLLLLALRVVADIVRSNIAVARIILVRRSHFTSGFVEIPLATDNPYVLAMLGTIITATPGTVWVRHDTQQRRLTIHVLDLIDEAAWVALIKQRYEQPLMEVFQ